MKRSESRILTTHVGSLVRSKAAIEAVRTHDQKKLDAEVADIVAVNKGDRPGADRAARQLRAMLSSAGGRIERQPPPVMMTTATTGEGVPALANAIEAHRATAREPLAALERAAHQVRRAIADLSARRAAEDARWEETISAVADRELDPLTAAERLLR